MRVGISVCVFVMHSVVSGLEATQTCFVFRKNMSNMFGFFFKTYSSFASKLSLRFVSELYLTFSFNKFIGNYCAIMMAVLDITCTRNFTMSNSAEEFDCQNIHIFSEKMPYTHPYKNIVLNCSSLGNHEQNPQR